MTGPRVSPHDIDIEKSLLGAVLLHDSAWADVAMSVAVDDWFRDAHRRIFEGMRRLKDRGVAVDFELLRHELQAAGDLDAVGGPVYLASLVDGMPRAANIEHYAAVVRDKARLRAFIKLIGELETEAYAHDATSADLVEAAMRGLMLLADDRRSAATPIGAAIRAFIEAMDEPSQQPLPTGFRDVDELLGGGLRRKELGIVAARPSTGKTSWSLGAGRHCAQHAGPVAMFSLEMHAQALAARLIGWDAKVAGTKLRTKAISPDEYLRIAESIEALGDVPLVIHDAAANLTQIGAWCQRLRQRPEGLALVIVDYLQLLLPERARASREAEVSAISRGLKRLASDQDVAVLAVSQLSRAPETRKDKRPHLSDLRECLSGDTTLITAAGQPIALSTVKPGQEILAIDSRTQRLKTARVADIWSTGVQLTMQATTQTGRRLVLTTNHPVLTPRGWRPFGSLRDGDLLATVRRIPSTESTGDRDLCRFLGYMAGNGSMLSGAVSFITPDEAVATDVKNIIAAHWPMITVREEKRAAWIEMDFSRLYPNGYGRPYGNELREWLRTVGVHGQRAEKKRAADYVMAAGADGAREFVAGYLATTGGCVKRRANRLSVCFDSVSRDLLEDVRLLCLRLDVVTSLSRGGWNEKSTQPIYRLSVCEDVDNLRRFASTIPVVGSKKQRLDSAVEDVGAAGRARFSIFSLPTEVSQYVASVNPKWRHQGKRPERTRMATMAEKTGDVILRRWATSDLLWEQIRECVPAGDVEVFDLRVPDTGCFIANGIVTHNSGALEQDADVAILLFREEMYRATEENRGIAEAIVAKQRSGATGVVKLYFAREYAWFTDLALT